MIGRSNLAVLTLFNSDNQPQQFPLFRLVTTLGSDPSCDIQLPAAGTQPAHAEIIAEGSTYQILPMDRGAEVIINGRKVKKALLANWDVIRLGDNTLVFSAQDAPFQQKQSDEKQAMKSLDRMAVFSSRLMEARSLDKALTTLLDETLALTQASKGFILFLENGVPVVKVARNIDRKVLPDDEALYSESIVQKTLEEGQPQLVTDAMSNHEFSGCTSVINLKLASVMCLPLKIGGETLGVLYLGTDRLLDLFDQVTLRSLNVYTAQASTIVQHVMLLESLERSNKFLKDEVQASRFGSLIGSCPSMRGVFDRISRVAPTDVPVLILGDTGTGKELVARELHGRSPRSNNPFVAINCGAIPENLLESELFGHTKGAFTGAVAATLGKFQLASGGTLFLDEIGEMPLQLQVKLLRVLQDNMVTRIGGTRPERVNVRVIAATNKNLQEEVREGRFREDLYYRINVVPITLPMLRERGDDITMLATFFLKKFAAEFQSPARSFSPEAMKAMAQYPWPGNIRELENRVRRAALFSTGPQVLEPDLELPDNLDDQFEPLAIAREKFERDYVLKALDISHQNRAAAARLLGVEPRTVFRYLERERDAGRQV